MKHIHFKATVRLKRWTKAIHRMFDAVEQTMNMFVWCPEIVITSINDSVHGAKSRHYTDEAIDLRTRNFTNEADKIAFIIELRAELGPKFTVLHESRGTSNEHIHVQVVKGGTYP